MKDFKKLIREAHLGNPLNEDKLPDGFHSREDLDQFYNDVAMDEYGKPFAELSIAQKQELISYMNRETEKQFQTDYEKRRKGDYSDDMKDGMTDYQRRRMDENKFKVGDEIVYRGDKPGKVVHVFDKKSFINPEVEYKIRYQSDGGTTTARVRGRDIALEKDLDDMGRKYFGKDYDLDEGTCGYGEDGVIGDKPAGAHLQKEDINDPALVRARAAQMKKDQRDREEAEYEAKQAALDKKYGSSFMDKLDAEISLKQELQDLKDEREQLMMDMEQEAEPEGGEIADLYGMKLNRIDLRTAEIKSELEDLRMYESVNEALPVIPGLSTMAIKMPSQEEVDKFFSITQNEMHYLNSKPVMGQKGDRVRNEIEPWDEYDLSNWNALVRKAKAQGKINEGYLERAIEDEKDPKKLAILKAKKEFFDNTPKEKRRGMSDDEIRKAINKLVNEDLQLDVDLYSKENPGIFSKADEKVQVTIPGGFGNNEGDTALEKALAKLGKKYASYKVKDVKELNEDEIDEELFTANEMGDEAVEKESNSSAYESLQESLRKKLRDRLK